MLNDATYAAHLELWSLRAQDNVVLYMLSLYSNQTCARTKILPEQRSDIETGGKTEEALTLNKSTRIARCFIHMKYGPRDASHKPSYSRAGIVISKKKTSVHVLTRRLFVTTLILTGRHALMVNGCPHFGRYGQRCTTSWKVVHGVIGGKERQQAGL